LNLALTPLIPPTSPQAGPARRARAGGRIEMLLVLPPVVAIVELTAGKIKDCQKS